MKTIVAACFLILSASIGVAQKCAYYKNEIDKFTGKTHITTKATVFGSTVTVRCDIYFVYNNDAFTVQLDYGEFSTMRTSMESDLSSDLSLSLADGSIVKLKPTEVFKGQVSYGNTCVFKPYYPITKEQLQALSKSPVQTFRMGIVQSSITKEVTEKNQALIVQAVTCLLQALGDSGVVTPEKKTEPKDSHRPHDPLGGVLYDTFHKKNTQEQTAAKTATPVSGTPNQNSTSPANINVADELIKLKKLLDEGVLTQQEFEAQKRKLLEAK